ncbi:mRNA splicing factor [Lipomyces japonicus]|uniref:mRNA splicing factor n=1 Tax=Lipomyces japonicus TaxID=56871 RepID=UPI0034CE1954
MSSLDLQALSRKERLAQLRNLKRKRPEGGSEGTEQGVVHESDSKTADNSKEEADSGAESIFIRRNYDPETRAPKQGFFEPPTATLDVPTVEQEAARIEQSISKDSVNSSSIVDDGSSILEREEQAEKKEGEQDEGDEELDITTLQPKRANWDLKRQIQSQLDMLQRQTDVAINRIVRERIKNTKVDSVPAGIDLSKAVDQREEEERA